MIVAVDVVPLGDGAEFVDHSGASVSDGPIGAPGLGGDLDRRVAPGETPGEVDRVGMEPGAAGDVEEAGGDDERIDLVEWGDALVECRRRARDLRRVVAASEGLAERIVERAAGQPGSDVADAGRQVGRRDCHGEAGDRFVDRVGHGVRSTLPAGTGDDEWDRSLYHDPMREWLRAPDAQEPVQECVGVGSSAPVTQVEEVVE